MSGENRMETIPAGQKLEDQFTQCGEFQITVDDGYRQDRAFSALRETGLISIDAWHPTVSDEYAPQPEEGLEGGGRYVVTLFRPKNIAPFQTCTEFLQLKRGIAAGPQGLAGVYPTLTSRAVSVDLPKNGCIFCLANDRIHYDWGQKAGNRMSRLSPGILRLRGKSPRLDLVNVEFIHPNCRLVCITKA